MVCLPVQDTKNKDVEWSTIPWTGGSNNFRKHDGKWKEPNEEPKRLTQIFNCVIDSNEWVWWMVALPSYRLTQTWTQCIIVKSPYISRNFPLTNNWQHRCVVRFTNISTILQSWFTKFLHSLFLKLPIWLSFILKSKVLKTFNRNLNHNHKFTKITRNTLCVNF